LIGKIILHLELNLKANLDTILELKDERLKSIIKAEKETNEV